MFKLSADGNRVIKLAGRGQDFDEFKSGLELDFGVIEMREGLFQVGLGGFGIAGAFLGDSQQRLNAPEPGLQLQGGTQRRDRVRELVLKEEEDSQVGLAVDIPGVERHDLTKDRNGKLGLLFLEMLLDLLVEGGDLLLSVLSREDGRE